MEEKKMIAAKKADNFLVSCGIKDAPVDLNKICDYLSINLEERFEIHDEMFGAYVESENGLKKYIILNNRYHVSRKRFVLAHLIGHSIFHNFHGLHYETIPPDLLYTNTLKAELEKKQMEIEANNFAIEILMPEKFLIREFRSRKILEYNKLANKYLVSEYVIKVRMKKIGLI
jgi:Zn-dependent peptidase ImmA (M78 family)